MVKGRKLALLATGIGVFSFSTFEPSFTPAMWASTSRLTDSRTDWQAELRNDVDDIDTVDIWEHYTPVSVKAPHDDRIPSKNVEALAALGAMWLDAERLQLEKASEETDSSEIYSLMETASTKR